MQEADVLIIGAGAAGLMAAKELSQSGTRITILEARNRVGGRIHTLHNSGFSFPVEAGAEFIHGELPVTFSLLKEANLSTVKMRGEVWQFKNNILTANSHFLEDLPLLIQKISELKNDIPLESFLQEYFHEDKYEALRKSVRAFAEGYDAADAQLLSTKSLVEEWAGEDDTKEYRVESHYDKLIEHLVQKCKEQQVRIYLNTVVSEIHWKKNQVTIKCTNGQTYYSNKVIITVPIGVLKSGAVTFHPAIPDRMKAIQNIGFGGVIKLLFEFKTAFWESMPEKSEHRMKDLSFLFSEEEIPTWWTQSPHRLPLLTGWLAGPSAVKHKDISDEHLVSLGLTCLSTIFKLDQQRLRNLLHHSEVFNWTSDNYSLGAYAYSTIHTPAARNALKIPVENTLYFAGEALYEGPEMGTVEAALSSGKEVATNIQG